MKEFLKWFFDRARLADFKAAEEALINRALRDYELVHKEKEIAICAAIKTTNGKIILGHRHVDAMQAARREGLDYSRGLDAGGFFTSRKRFVDREEALNIQLAAGQPVSEGSVALSELYSEDLY